MAGLSAAKARGRVGGRKAGLSVEAIAKAKAVKTLFEKGDRSMDDIAKAMGLSRATAYRYLDKVLAT